MDSQNTISRRSLLRAAAPAVAAIALPAVAEAATSIPPAADLEKLALGFKEAAMAMDPTVTGGWIMRSESIAGPRESRVAAVYLEREDAPFVRRAQSRPKASPVAKAIEAHKRARQAFEDSCDAADEMHPSYGGKAAEAVWSRLDRAEQRKLNHLLRLPAIGRDAADRAAYLLQVMKRGDLERADFITLLQSIAGVAPTAPLPIGSIPAPSVGRLAESLAAAIAAETAAYSTDNENEALCNATTGKSGDAVRALVKLPHTANTEPLYREALALAVKWFLVAEGMYQNEGVDAQALCRLVDATLTGSRFGEGKVPMLWHVNGESRDTRPAEPELQAKWN